MQTIVNGLASLVRRYPWWTIIATIIITLVLGPFAGQFTPEEESNASFVPNAPELLASDKINDLFGSDASVSALQIILTAESGNVFSQDGFQAVQDISATVMTGALSDRLISTGGPPIVSFFAPVEQSIRQGAPPPASDTEIQQRFLLGLASMPAEQSDRVRGLLPRDADLDQAVSPQGLVLVTTRGEKDGTELYDQFVATSRQASDEILATPLPVGITALPFSFELLFDNDDQIQGEVGRLFGTAFLIILLVLALVFMVRPKRRAGKWVQIGGITAVAISLLLVILASLGVVLDSLLPDVLKEWNSNLLFLVAALVLVVVFLVWAFTDRGLRRSAADTMLTIIAVLLAISWMQAIGFLLFGDASPITQILPILLTGLGVDYSIHLNSRYRDERSSGVAVDDAIRSAIRTVGIALVLGTVTTAVGFLTNVINDIPALREFGFLAAFGILASFLLMLTFVPAVRELLDRRGTRRQTVEPERLQGGESRFLGRMVGGTAVIANKAAALTTIVALGLGGLGVWGWANLETKFSFLDFVPVTSPLRDTFFVLTNDFGGGFGEETQVLIEGDVADVQTWNAMVAANNNLLDTPNVVSFGNLAGTSPVSVIAQLGNPDSPNYVPAVGVELQAQGFDFPTRTFPAGANPAAVYDLAWEADPRLATTLTRGPTGYEIALFTITTQAGETGAGALIVALDNDFQPVRDLNSVTSVVATSDEIINEVIVTTLRGSQFSSLILTLSAALLLLVANFWYQQRRPMLGVITTLPVILTTLWAFALMLVFGIPFGPVTATIAALAIGIGIDYMIHITHRFQEDLRHYAHPGEAIRSTLTHTGGALFGSAITAIAGFGVLTTSATIPFQQFGFVTSYTVALAMLTAILVLPSMLILWVRWHERTGKSVTGELNQPAR